MTRTVDTGYDDGHRMREPVAGSVMVRTSNSQSREVRFESSRCCFEALAISFTPHCHSSLSCINEYLVTDSGGFVNE